MLKKITSRVELLGFFIYLCAMDNLKNFIVKNKYDLLSIGCVCLMFSVSVVFAIPAIVFVVIDVVLCNILEINVLLVLNLPVSIYLVEIGILTH